MFDKDCSSVKKQREREWMLEKSRNDDDDMVF